MSLSACTVGNDHEDIFTTSDITDTHSESDSADTQTVTDLTVEDVPTLVPDVLKLREVWAILGCVIQCEFGCAGAGV